jgi:hypothetical protein
VFEDVPPALEWHARGIRFSFLCTICNYMYLSKISVI